MAEKKAAVPSVHSTWNTVLSSVFLALGTLLADAEVYVEVPR